MDVTDPDYDAWKISFPFSVVDSSLVGTKAEINGTKYHRVIVKISGMQRASWARGWELETNTIDWVKVLFQYCRGHVEEKIRTRSLQTDEVIDLSNTDPRYDPSRIEDPSGLEIIVEEETPKVGFH